MSESKSLQPERAYENSPPFQRRESVKTAKSPQGTAESFRILSHVSHLRESTDTLHILDER
jgi:hypothetical protein